MATTTAATARGDVASASVAPPSPSATASSSSSSASASLPYGSERLPHEAQRVVYLVPSALRVTLQVLLLLVTGGLAALPMLWSVRFRCWFLARTSAARATSALVADRQGRYAHVRISADAVHAHVRTFEFKCLRYAYDPHVDAFVPPRAMGVGEHSARDILNAVARVKAHNKDGDSRVHAAAETQWRVQAGANELRVAMGSLPWGVAREVLGPVYIYQYLCVVLWILHDYIAFGIIILLLIWASAAYDLFLRRRNRARVRALAAYRVPVRAWTRVGAVAGWVDGVDSAVLLPGDVVQLSADALPWTAPCDLALVQGVVSVDEASLTGESLPVVKTAPEQSGADKKRFEVEKEKRTCVYSGTHVLSVADDKATLVVMRTGFQTAKGQLLRNILHATHTAYTYEREARYFVAVLAGVSLLFFGLGLWLWGAFEPNGFDPKKLLYAFETIAILVPPMLPLVFHVGLLLSARNLQELHVFTTAPARIPGAGTLRTFCFDKTGTLTKNELDVIGAIPLKTAAVPEFTRLHALAAAPAELARLIATCHQLAVLPGSRDLLDSGATAPRYSGPAIDVKLFAALRDWRYEEATFAKPARVLHEASRIELELLRRCEFEHSLQRMCVVTRDVHTSTLNIVCKGSIEAITAVCEPDSLPKDVLDVAKDYARNGCYVLALGRRVLPPNTDATTVAALPRPQLEAKLRFAGLLLLRNELKEDSRAAILALKRGRIRPLMVTGDNIFTGFYIAPLPLDDRLALSAALAQGAEFGVTSAAYERLRERAEQGESALQHFLNERVRIFARMKPLQKEQVVADLMRVGHVTGMCGDGANDCAALSKSHCGVALSEAEASLVSAFTARSLSCMATVDLVREGRSSLDNSFAAFRFTILYGIVQVTQTMLCYCYGSDLSQGMYILIDFVYFVMFFIVKSRAVARLKGNPPPSNVFGPTTLASILGSALIALAAFFVTLYALEHEPGYRRSVRKGHEPEFETPESTSLFLVGAFIYAGAGVAYGWGGRWRQRFWHNAGLTVCALLVVVSALVLLFLDGTWDVGVATLLKMHALPLSYRLLLLLVGAVAFVDLLLYELLVVTGPVANWLRRATHTGRRPQLENEDSPYEGEVLDKSSFGDNAIALEEEDEDSDDDRLDEELDKSDRRDTALTKLDV